MERYHILCTESNLDDFFDKALFNCVYNVIQITEIIVNFYLYNKLYKKTRKKILGTILDELIVQATFQISLEHDMSHRKYLILQTS